MDDGREQATAPFDMALLKRRRRAGRCGPAYLLKPAGEELLARLADAWRELAPGGEGVASAGREEPQEARRQAQAGCFIACGPAWLATALRTWASGQMPRAEVLHGQWLAAAEASARDADDIAAGDGIASVVLDHERLPFADAVFDVALVLFDFALVNDLPAALRQWRRVLKPGGLLLAVLPGGETLHELRAAFIAAERMLAHERGMAGEDGDVRPGWRVAPFLEVRQLAGLAGMAGFTRVVTDVERLRVRHADALSLMRELKEAGWSNPLAQRPRTPMSRHLLGLAAAQYEISFAADDGRVPATFEMLYLTATRPAPAAIGSNAAAQGGACTL